MRGLRIALLPRFPQNHFERFGENTLAQTENCSRERILARIRTALKAPGTGAVAHHARSAPAPLFATISDAFERFQQECAGNNTELIVTPNARASAAALNEVLAPIPAGEVFVQDAPVLRRMPLSPQIQAKIRWSTESAPSENAQATVTLADVLVAQTGSVVVSAACGGRGASFVAPVHIVLATVGQLVPTLDAAFARLRERGMVRENSYLCLITGSSRTADIEKILVMGAHGPRRFVVILALSEP